MVRAEQADIEADRQSAREDVTAFEPPWFHDQEGHSHPEFRAALACVADKEAALRLLQSEQADIEAALQTAREEVQAWEALCFREQEILEHASPTHPAEE